MAGNNPSFKNKISPLVQDQLPTFVQDDHPLFITLLKHYYEFMEGAQISLGGFNDYIIQETNSVNYVLDQNGDNIVLETSVAKFVTGETIVGDTSKSSAKIIVDDYDNAKKIYITSQQRFNIGEKVTGQTSGASAVVTDYKANPIQNIQQLLAYADVDNTVFQFLDKFKQSILNSIPETIAEGIDQRNLIKNIKDLYEAKGTEDGHRLFFRILFDEESEFLYPRESMLKTSDGQWSDDFVMRVVEIGTSNFNELIGQTITGQTSGATAIVSSLVKFKSGTTLVTELNLDQTTLNGTFTIGEIVKGISTELDLEISATLSGIVGEVTITDGPVGMAGMNMDRYGIKGGQYYEVGDAVAVEKLGTIGVRGQVSRIGAGSIDEIYIANRGTGYNEGDVITFDNANTNGVGAAAKLAVVGGSLLLEPFTAPDSVVQNCTDVHDLIIEHAGQIDLQDATITTKYLELESATGGDRLVQEDDDALLIIDESDSEDITYQGEGLLLEDGFKLLREETNEFNIGLEQDADGVTKLLLENGDDIIIESQTFTDLGVATEAGQITKVTIIDDGNGYTSLPSMGVTRSVANSSATDAELIAISNSGVGSVKDVNITNYGLEYTGDPKVTFNKKLIIANATGNYTIGDTLTSFTGSIVEWDSNTRLLELQTPVDDFVEGDIITSVGGITGTVVQETGAFGSAKLESVVRSDGAFITDRGKISEDTMRVQDSFYYQDYSYVVRIGESINQWRESIRNSVHPAGWNVFGEVSFATSLAEAQTNSLRIQAPTAGGVQDFTADTDTFTPELASTLTNLFTEIFGRRLGTLTDGSTLREEIGSLLLEDGKFALLETGHKIITVRDGAMTGTSEPLQSGIREVTLTSSVSVKVGTGNNIGKQQTVLGPTLDLLPKYAFAVPPVLDDGKIPNYPGIYRSPRGGHNSGAYFTIDQFGQYPINHVSTRFGTLDSFDDTTQTFDSSTTSFDDNDIVIPPIAFKTKINVPPPGEIKVTRGTKINAFDNNFLTFDNANNTYDESGTPRASAATFYTSFDETGAITFDETGTKTFDEGQGQKSFDTTLISMDSTAHTLDETL